MKKRRNHTDEFKRDAVKLMMNRGTRTVDEVAKRLGISPSLLHRWYLQYGEAIEAGRSQESLKASEDVEALRRRVRQLEQENALLKKAAADSRDESNIKQTAVLSLIIAANARTFQRAKA